MADFKAKEKKTNPKYNAKSDLTSSNSRLTILATGGESTLEHLTQKPGSGL